MRVERRERFLELDEVPRGGCQQVPLSLQANTSRNPDPEKKWDNALYSCTNEKKEVLSRYSLGATAVAPSRERLALRALTPPYIRICDSYEVRS